MVINELQKVNRQLDSRVQRLSSLFELSKEFGSFAESFRVVKLLVFSILGQFLVQKYAVVLFENDEADILDSKFDNEKLLSLIKKYEFQKIADSIKKDALKKDILLNRLNGS